MYKRFYIEIFSKKVMSVRTYYEYFYRWQKINLILGVTGLWNLTANTNVWDRKIP